MTLLFAISCLYLIFDTIHAVFQICELHRAVWRLRLRAVVVELRVQIWYHSIFAFNLPSLHCRIPKTRLDTLARRMELLLFRLPTVIFRLALAQEEGISFRRSFSSSWQDGMYLSTSANSSRAEHGTVAS